MSLCIFLSLLVSLPLYIEIEYVMNLWLVNPPVMAVEFVRLLIISAFFALITLIFTIGIEATGYNWKMNIYTGSIFMLTIPVMYLFFKQGFGVLYSYYCILGANILIFLSNMVICKHLVPSVRLTDYMWLFLKSVLVIILSIVPAVFIVRHYDASFLRVIANTAVILCLCSALSYWLILDVSSRSFVRQKLHSVIKIIHK